MMLILYLFFIYYYYYGCTFRNYTTLRLRFLDRYVLKRFTLFFNMFLSIVFCYSSFFSICWWTSSNPTSPCISRSRLLLLPGSHYNTSYTRITDSGLALHTCPNHLALYFSPFYYYFFNIKCFNYINTN